ncbi:amino acid adenylation domain-containing protein [Metabacillus sp. Hm71]|uniref:amino acid adenylation domain-containing protein n=1 Tax=Metabacillus sp. Hm71 TaxID=3450743 RepID=UPI003F41E7FF
MVKLDKQHVEDILSLTPIQEGILFHYLKDTNSEEYFEQLSLEISGAINMSCFTDAWESVIQTNESLRTLFRWEKLKAPVQIVLKQQNLKMEFIDLVQKQETEKQVLLEEIRRKDRETGFDLREVPFRITLCKFAEDRYEMIISHHHILYDGWSNGIMLKEFLEAYQCRSRSEMYKLPVKRKYKDFIKYIQSQDKEKQKRFWQEYLNGFDAQTMLEPKKKKETSIRNDRHNRIRLPKGEWQAFAQKKEVTLASVMYSIWGIVLQKNKNSDDILFGSTISGRAGAFQGIEEMVGLFINTIPLRIRRSPGETAFELIKTVNKSLQDWETYGTTSLPDIKRYSELDEKTDLFDTIVVFENYPLDQTLRNKNGGEITFNSYSAFEMTNYGLSLTIHVLEDIEICFSYNEQLFDTSTIERLAQHFLVIANDVLKNPNKQVEEIEIISSNEKQQILYKFNRTEAPYSTNVTISELVEQQVEKTPDHIAIVDKGRNVSYKKLNEMANSLANALLCKGIKKGEIVGIMIGPSIEMVAGILAVLKAGAAYLPIDPEYPESRKRLIVEDSGTRFLLTDQHSFAQRENHASTTILLLDDSGIFSGETASPEIDRSPEDLFAVFYTSGTTGKPKGVMVENRSVVNLIQWFGKTFDINEQTNLLQLTNFVFDPSIEDFFGTLVFGATLHVAEKDLLLNKDRFCEYVDQRQIHMINFIPTVLKELLCHNRRLKSLHTVISGGERLEESLKNDLIDRGYNLYNHYGPTEITVDALSSKCSEKNVTLGKPISNVRCYILDKDQNLCPIGVPGEMYIAGAGVARGYLNMPEATNEKFVKDPFFPNERMYKTGDLARWISNGEIEFLGRTDHQIKIRGYRVELAEIHELLLKLEYIQEVAVIDWENEKGRKVLCAYLVSNTEIHAKKLKDYLSSKLPEYMVPTYFIQLEKLPLTSIGKIDRKNLPAPKMQASHQHVAPTGKKEKDLAEVWSSVLGIDTEAISINDNFFELGGDSISSIQLVGKALQKGIEITVSQVFKHQTIAELAASAAERTVSHPEVKAEEKVAGEVLLTPIQKWFFEQDLQNRHLWNQSILLETMPAMNVGTLRKSFHILTEHHDSFRLRYDQKEGEWVQSYADSQENVIFENYAFDQYHEQPLDHIISKIQYGLNIKDGPLIRAAYFDFGNGQNGRLFITAHHLVVDGYSWRVILDDLQAIYEQLESSTPVQLPMKSLSFKRWSELLYEYAKSDQLKNELSYWMNNTPTSIKKLPVDMEGGLNTEKAAHTLSFKLTKEETAFLLQDHPHLFKTRIDDLLLTALSKTLSKWSGATLIDLEGHGRVPLLQEHNLSRTVGWFTCVYPTVLGDMEPNSGMEDVLKQVKERYRSIPMGGIGYEIITYLAEDELSEQLTSKPRAQISFNYLGQHEQAGTEPQLFMLSEVNAGTNRDVDGIRSHLLDIDCMIVDKKLSIEWKYSSNHYFPETIQRLTTDFIHHLKEIIESCQTTTINTLTPSDFPFASIEQGKLDEFSKRYKAIQDIYTLTPVQQSMIFHHIYSPDSSVTVEQTVFSIESKLNIKEFEQVWQTILDRHDSLRTSYHWAGLEEPVQVVHRNLKVPFQVVDWTNLSKHERMKSLEMLLEEDRKKGFDLSEPPLMRILVVKRGESAYDVVWTHHHLQVDGWCNSILFKEIGEIYKAYCTGEKLALGKARSFKDYIEWLRRQDKQKAEQFWRKTLKGFKEPIRFSDLFSVKAGTNEAPAFGDVSCAVSQEKQDVVQAFARKHRITLNTLVQGAWALLLNRYSGEKDLTFGVTSSGRPAELNGSDSMIGCFMNTLPFRIKIDPGLHMISWLKELQVALAEMRQYEYTSLADIRSWSEVPRNSALYDLYESIVIVENYPFDAALKDGMGDLEISSVRTDEQMDYPLVVYCNLQPDLHFKLLYDSRFLNEPEANQVLAHFMNILWEITEMDAENGQLSSISMIPESELNQILFELNPTAMEYPKDVCFQDLFATQVKAQFVQPAVIQNGESLSYYELDLLSNKLANRLTRLGVGPDVPVGLYVERSLNMIVGILGIIKAGGAFLPIDADYPGERVDMMLEDAQVSVLLTLSSLEPNLLTYEGRTIFLDVEWDGILEEPVDQPRAGIEPKNLAYIIYTSGSSGRPKGVMMPHEAVVSHSIDMINRYELKPWDRVLQFSSISFDISLEQIFTALAAGSTLVLRDHDLWTPYQFSQKCAEYGLTVVNLPTSYWGEITQAWHGEPELIPNSHLRLVIVGGEQMSGEKVRMWEKAPLHHISLLNAYGPAETAMTSTLYHVSGNGMKSSHLPFIPVGKPLANRRIYILDKEMNPLPIGVKGEICISGLPLARGYLNNPEMSKGKFIQDPFEKGSRLYKTGDMGKLLHDGNIQVLGRMDDQIKIRGHRIEIGEIEAALNKLDQIVDSAVVVKADETNEKYLAAYYASAVDSSLDPSEMRRILQSKIPEYMIPSFFIEMEKLPLNPNGKIDRKSLSAMQIKVEMTDGYEMPYNETQLKLASIWENILGVDGVGINHSFFEMGGQSLKAITLASEIHREFHVELPLIQVFTSPTIKELAVCIEELTEKEGKLQSIKPAAQKEYYEVSPAQKRMYIVSQLNGSSTNYHISGAVRLEGKVDLTKLEKSFQALINRHESLRTSFKEVDGSIMQKVHQDFEWSIQYLHANESNVEQVIEAFIKPFDLAKGPLFRAAVIELSPANYVLVYDMHHIVSDGLSVAILIREFATLYQGKNLPDPKIQYKDFSAWQNERIESGKVKHQEEYWLNRFSGEIPLLNLPTDFPRLGEPMVNGDQLQFSLDEHFTAKLHEISMKNGVTLYNLLLSAFNVLLYKYSGQNDIVVGSPVSGRRHAELENMVGMFVNTLALRNNLNSEKRFDYFVSEVANQTRQALEHQEYPFEMLVDKLPVQKSLNRHPLFDVMLAFENVDEAKAEIGEFVISPCEYKNRTTKFDLELKITEQEGILHFVIEYRTGLFRRDTVEQMAKHLVRLFEVIKEDIAISIGEIDLLTTEEKNQLIKMNDTDALFPEEKTIKRLFEEQVAMHPNHTAVVCGDRRMTYKELNARANQLANHLIKKGARPSTVVGLLAEPSIDMIVGLWGIIKSGATYLPIDPEFPEDRMHFMLESSHAAALVCMSHLYPSTESCCEVIELDHEDIASAHDINLEDRSTPDDPVYLIYTSGTTGYPKGVPIKHQSLVNYVSWFTRAANITDTDKTVLVSSFAFDLGYTGLYTALVNGCELHVVPKELYTVPRTFLTYLKDQQISFIKLTPSLFKSIVDNLTFEEDVNRLALRLIVLGGEEMKSADIVKFHNLCPNIEVMNHYGPTEATIGCIAYKLDFEGYDPLLNGTIIGKPIDNVKVLILNQHQQPVPIGGAGEICIAGAGLTEGYLNQAELNTEKFIEGSIWGHEPIRLYKTGDLGRITANGNIQFLGRIDHQLKIRGYRVELDEVTSVILQHETIENAFVTPHVDEEGNHELHAYLVLKEGENGEGMRDYLSNKLPYYMVPSVFVKVNGIPLTANGKLDLKALEEIRDASLINVEYEKPKDIVEQKIADIWEEVLDVEKVGMNDSFFEMGGNSLKIMLVTTEIHKQFNVTIPLRESFKTPTIRGMSDYIKKSSETKYFSLQPLAKRDYYELSSAQKRLYTIHQMEGLGTTYNMPRATLLEGEMNLDQLEDAFGELVNRHEALRTSFEIVKGEVKQRIHDDAEVKIIYSELKEEMVLEPNGELNEKLINIMEGFIKPFDLTKAPLVKIQLIRLNRNQHVLLTDMHHLISDGYSVNLLLHEFSLLYQGQQLEENLIQYKDYVGWQHQFLKTKEAKKQEEYWLDILSGNLPVLQLPTNFPRPLIQNFEGDSFLFKSGKEMKQRLEQLCSETNSTPYMVLTAAYSILLSTYSSQQDIIIGLPILGRTHSDLKHTIGMFANTIVIRTFPNRDESFVSFLSEVKEQLLKAYDNQDYQLEMLLDKLKMKREPGRNPLFSTMLALQDAPKNERTVGNLKLNPVNYRNKTSKFDLSLFVENREEGMLFEFEYASSLFTRETIKKFADDLLYILDFVSLDKERRIDEIEIVGLVAENEGIENVTFQF